MTKKKKIGLGIGLGIVGALLVAIIVYSILVWAYFASYKASKEEFDVSASEMTEEVTVMSYNVRCLAYNSDFLKKSWFYRADLVLKVIASEKPDIIGFQEINTEHEKYLKEHLKGYAFYCAYRDNSLFKEGLMIAYRTDRFALENEGVYWLSETPEKMSKGWDAVMNRITVFTNLTEKKTGKKIAFYDTHLDHIGEQARINSMKLISDKIIETAPDCAFVVGDMNDFDDSPVYENALKSGLVDALKVAEKSYVGKGCTYQGFGKSTGDRRIDFCFLSPSVTVKDYHVNETTFDGVYPSDHYPIIVKALL